MTYEYACQACGHTWEAEQSIKDKALTKCESCGAPKAKRLVSGGTGFLLKGGGWYADGYGSAAASKSAGGDSEGSSTAPTKPGDAATTKSESAAGGSKSEGSKSEASKDSGDSSATKSADTSAAS